MGDNFWKHFLLKISSLLTFDLSGTEFQVENCFHLELWRQYSCFLLSMLPLRRIILIPVYHLWSPSPWFLNLQDLFCLFQCSEFTMMWGFFHSCEHSVGLDNLEKTHASLWGWFAYVISLMISSPLFSLFFFLALLLVRNDTPWLYPLMVLFTSFYCPLLYLFFYFLGDFLNIAFGHFCWLFLFVCFAIVVLIAKSLCFFL